MYRYGPLVHHWTMRYEAKHSYFKGLAHAMGNFLNLPYSLAMRHQQLRCYWSTSEQETPGGGLDIGPGCTIPTARLQEELGETISSAYEYVYLMCFTFICRTLNELYILCHFHFFLHFFRARWIKIDGTEYKRDAGIVHSMSHDLPQVARIASIYVVNGNTVIFRATCYTTTYNAHYRSYLLHDLHSEKLFFSSKLVLHTPVHIRTSQALPHCELIILPHYCR